ncbi:hypothetical protein KC878_01340 [Candidatus Saccharibacteria bacterium]|nr:hypothetical protein [Candidatus Saccharibacteria bacterium]MCB9821129.1 hypothetical protein [Candidatus Nomurabacteria bacterium]
MITIIKRSLLIFGLLGMALTLVAAAGPDRTFADEQTDAVIGGASQVPGQGGGTKLTSVVKNLLTVLSWVAGVISVIMMVVSGIQISVANGDASKVGRARNSIIYAVVGLVVVILAQTIVRFALNNIT